MTSAASVGHCRRRHHLGIGSNQVIGYGRLYYSFSVLVPDMAKDFEWSQEWLFGVFSGSLLLGGLAAPFIGRWMDRYGAARMMSLGSVIAAVALLVCGLAPDRMTFIVGMVAIEMASAFVLYNAAFALLVQVTPQTAQRSITHLTLIGGFASTVFWPITSELHGHLTWREVYVVFAGINLFVCLPVHVWLSSTMKAGTLRDTSAPPSRVPAVVGSISIEDRKKTFLLMAVGFALEGFVLSALLIHMVPLLTAVGWARVRSWLERCLAPPKSSADSSTCCLERAFRS